jgi:hypothetical protein
VRGTGKTGASVGWASEASAGVGWTGQARGTTSVAGNASVSTAGRVEELTSAGVVVVAKVVAVVGSAVVELVALLGVGAAEASGAGQAGAGRTSEAGASLVVTSLTSETRASRAVLVVVRAGEAWASQTGAGVGRASQTGTVVTGKTAVVVGTAVGALLETGTGEVVWNTVVASATAGDVRGLLALLTVHVLDAATVEGVLSGVVWCGVAVVGVLSGGGITVKTLGLVGADLDLVATRAGLVANGVGLTARVMLAKVTGEMGWRCVSCGFNWYVRRSLRAPEIDLPGTFDMMCGLYVGISWKGYKLKVVDWYQRWELFKEDGMGRRSVCRRELDAVFKRMWCKSCRSATSHDVPTPLRTSWKREQPKRSPNKCPASQVLLAALSSFCPSLSFHKRFLVSIRVIIFSVQPAIEITRKVIWYDP